MIDSIESPANAPRRKTPPVLTVKDLHVSFTTAFGMTHALRGVDLEIHRGEILAVVGESGSGKSSLGLAILGLLAEQSQVQGSIALDDHEVVGAVRDVARNLRRSHVRAVFQDPMTSLNPTMRVGHQLEEAITDDTSSEEWLRLVGIPEPGRRLRTFPHQLSGGQRQRVMIAMAMAARPSLVVADEPTTALDVTVQRQILHLFRQLREEQGSAFLFITHDLAVASEIADRIVVLYAGRVAETGPVEAVVGSPAHPYSAALLEARFDLGADRGHQLPTISAPGSAAAVDMEGCAFAPRCILAVPDCIAAQPPLAPVQQHTGLAACIRSDEVTANLWEQTAADWPNRRVRQPGPLVEISQVRKSFARQRFGSSSTRRIVALQGVSLAIALGESVAIVGESGSGKSTLLRLVAGLIPPDEGSIHFFVPDEPQLVYQDAYASLTPWLTVTDLVGERLRRQSLSRGERDDLVIKALQRVGLSKDVAALKPPNLSGGQRQRVAIARTIVVPPKLLLCDEPVSAIDVTLAAAMLNLLRTLRLQLGMAMLFVTHDLAAARFIADRVAVMNNGEIVEEGPTQEVILHPSSQYTRLLLASMPGVPDVR
jgi:peptide/nickel transport system ATP-binding protein